MQCCTELASQGLPVERGEHANLMDSSSKQEGRAGAMLQDLLLCPSFCRSSISACSC